MRSLLFISALILSAPSAQAALTINSISGASNSSIVANTTPPTTTGGTATPAVGTASATVYGGTAGHDGNPTTPGPSCTVKDGLNACDSCPTAVCADNLSTVDQAPLCACNRSRIYDTLAVSIAVTRAAGDNGPIRAIATSTSTTGSTGQMTYITQPGPGISYVNFYWKEVCARAGSATCEAFNGQIVITIFSDKDNNQAVTAGEDKVDVTFKIQSPGSNSNVFANPTSEGIGDFLPFPGDDRIYLTRLNTTNNFPSLSYGSTILNTHVYLSDVSLDKATPKDHIQPDNNLPTVAGSAELTQDFIDEVINDKLYFVRLAMMDESNNIVQFYPDIKGTDKFGVDNSAICNSTGTPGKSCPFSVVPNQVLGLLNKDFNCFIASAAYGSSLEPKLKLFRDFRQQILLTTDWGRNFVMKYYTYGPYAARYIQDKPILRSITRGFLWPLAGFSWLALQIGFTETFFLSILLLTSGIILPLVGFRRISNRA